MRAYLLAALLILSLIGPALAQDNQELSENLPVCIVSSTQGDCEIKRLNGDWRPVYWLDLVRPQDHLRTGTGGKIVVNFFFDDHLEIVDPDTEAEVAFKNMKKVSEMGSVRRDEARDRTRATIDIPYIFLRKLKAKDFVLAEEPNAMEKENLFLQAFVNNKAYPPVFQWGAVPGTMNYRIQMFNEWDEFMHEWGTKDTRWKFPYKAPFQMQKAGLYQWQVLTPGDDIVVRKYKFYVLTQLQTKEVERAQKRFAELKRTKKITRTHYADLFLLYNRLSMVDERLHLLQEMSAIDPENPVIYRGLVRSYLDKSCPAHALEAHQRELQLGGIDDIET
ncbi:MAG: hypothetical protein AB1758_05535 [Candidatus Eremiobacterota bacterium]